MRLVGVTAGHPADAMHLDLPRPVRLNFTHDLQSLPSMTGTVQAPARHGPARSLTWSHAGTGSRLRMPPRPGFRIINCRSPIRQKAGRNVRTVHGHDAGWVRGLSRRSATRPATLVSATCCARGAETPSSATQLDVPDSVADDTAGSGDGPATHHAVAAAATRRGRADRCHAAVDRHRAGCVGG